MCHPHAKFPASPASLTTRESLGVWGGALQLYCSRLFLFGSLDANEDEADEEMILRDFYNAGQSMRDEILEFISHVRARTVIDMACRHEREFVLNWTRTDRCSTEAWKLLEDQCIMRENLDLFYVGGLSRMSSSLEIMC